MYDDYWNEIMKAEDRIIENSDRKQRYHFNSLEAMSEELLFRTSAARLHERDLADSLAEDSFIESVEDKKLAKALLQLTGKQLQAVELFYWQGLKHREIALIMGIKRSAVTRLIDRAYEKIRETMNR